MRRAWAAVAVGIAVLVIAWWRAEGPRTAGTTAHDAGSVTAPHRATTATRGAPTTIIGRVTRRADGGGIAGATVSFTGTDWAARPVAVATNAHGAWSAAIPPGTYSVAATADGFLPHREDAVLAPGGRVDMALDAGGLAVSGAITDSGGGGIADARVAFALRGASVVALTRADGRYRLNLAEGQYLSSVQHEAYLEEVREIVVAPPATTLDFVLVPGGSIRGQVVASDTGRPVPDAVLDASGGRVHATSESAVADADGTFVLDQIGPGAISITASARGYASGGPTIVEHAMGEQLDKVRVVVQPAFAITGRVGVAGAGIAGVAVSTGHRHAVSDDSGAFELVGILPGAYEIAAYEAATTRTVEPVAVVVVDRDVANLTIELQPAQSFEVSGRVEPPIAATVTLDGDIATTDAKGAFAFHHVARGEREVRAVANDDRIGRVTIDLTAPRSDVAIVLAGGAAVTGRVADDEGNAVAGARVQASLASDRDKDRTTRTTADGSYRLAGLRSGRVHVEVTLDDGIHDDLAKPVEVDVAAGATRPDVNLVVPARRHAIHGQVVDASGAPVADAWVRVLGDHDMTTLAPVVTKSDGSFAIEHLRHERYAMWAEGPRGDGSAHGSATPDGERVVLKLAPPGSIAVHVTQSGAPVRAYDLDCVRQVHVLSPDGTYLVDHVDPRKYRCSATTQDGTGASDVAVTSGVVRLELEIPHATEVAGIAVDMLTGAPVGGIRIYSRDMARPDLVTDVQGRFVIGHVPLKGELIFQSPFGSYGNLGVVMFEAVEGQRIELGKVRIAAPNTGEPGWLGLSIDRTDARITWVERTGPADLAGIKAGDVVVAIDGVAVAGATEAAQTLLLVGIVEGRTVRLGLARGATIAVTAGAQPQ